MVGKHLFTLSFKKKPMNSQKTQYNHQIQSPNPKKKFKGKKIIFGFRDRYRDYYRSLVRKKSNIFLETYFTVSACAA